MSETQTQAPHEADHAALVDMLATDQESGISPEDAQAYQELIDHNRNVSREAIQEATTTQIEVKNADTGAESVAVHLGNHALSEQPEWVSREVDARVGWRQDEKGQNVKDGIYLDEQRDMAVSSGNWKSKDK